MGYHIPRMMYHIYNVNVPHRPLCWDDLALEFEHEEDAILFLNHIPDLAADPEIIVKRDILFYDGGYLDATGKIPLYDEHNNLIKLVEAQC